MEIEIKLFASFRTDRFSRENRSVPVGITVLDIIRQLNIPEEEVGITMINNRHCQREAIINDKDRLSIFPRIGGG